MGSHVRSEQHDLWRRVLCLDEEDIECGSEGNDSRHEDMSDNDEQRRDFELYTVDHALVDHESCEGGGRQHRSVHNVISFAELERVCNFTNGWSDWNWSDDNQFSLTPRDKLHDLHHDLHREWNHNSSHSFRSNYAHWPHPHQHRYRYRYRFQNPIHNRSTNWNPWVLVHVLHRI